MAQTLIDTATENCKICGKLLRVKGKLIPKASIISPLIRDYFCKCRYIRCKSCKNKLRHIIVPVSNRYEKDGEYIKGYNKFDGYYCRNTRCEMFQKRIK